MAREATIKTIVKWQVVGNKYSAKFFKLVGQKNCQVAHETCLYQGSDSHNVAFSGRGSRHWQLAVKGLRVQPWIGVHPRGNSTPLEAR